MKREHAVLPGRIPSPDEAKEPTPPRHQILRLLKRGKIRPQHRRTESASLEERKKISRGKTRSKNKSTSYKEGYKQHYFDSDEQDDEFRKSASNLHSVSYIYSISFISLLKSILYSIQLFLFYVKLHLFNSRPFIQFKLCLYYI